MKFKRHDLSPIRRFIETMKIPILGYIFGFSVCMMISNFKMDYSFFAGVIASIIFYGISKAP